MPESDFVWGQVIFDSKEESERVLRPIVWTVLSSGQTAGEEWAFEWLVRSRSWLLAGD